MRDFTKVSPSIWRSRKFRGLPNDKARLAYLYVLTCPHGNSAGCFDLHPMYAAADLHWEEMTFVEALQSLEKASLIEMDWAENTLLIVNWETFNEPTNPRHAQGILAQLLQASSDSLKAKAFHRFLKSFRARGFDRDKALRDAIQSLLKDYPETIPTETETKREMETERETRPDKDLDLRVREATAPPAPSQVGGGQSPPKVNPIEVNPELVRLAQRLDMRTPDSLDLTIPPALRRKRA